MVAALMDERGLAQPPPMDEDAAFHAAKKVRYCVTLLFAPPPPPPHTLVLSYSMSHHVVSDKTFKRHLKRYAGEHD